MTGSGAAQQAPDIRHRARQAMRIAGGCSLVLAAATLLWPGRTASSLAMIFGAALLLSALAQAFLALWAHIAMVLRLLALATAVLTFVLALLAFNGGHVELLALWLGIGWAIRGIVQALTAAWDDGIVAGWPHEVCGVGTCAIGLTVIAIKFETVTGLATVAGGGLIVIGALELLAGGMLRPAWSTATAAAGTTVVSAHATAE
ncbi:DUF308 domain-containing protein [Nocardia halotolerans]|uniref:DUF308 domain-containing protein n=1 Tax=Nocardia halotolerans TaxID=1755878 RepID=A0ABV8VC05_9NOCA